MTRPYAFFTPAEDEAVLSDRPAADIAAEIGRTPKDVHRRRAALRGNTGTGGQPWEQADDRAILADDRPDDRVLAKKLGRSVQAIQIRRCLIRKRS